ncbi:hypothetical protein [Candidatus Enterococcus mansonii]|uniref:Phage protein n=1 Tax=Candidatus Enterococcus mansonii TaxID=1834181 RepID=A0A242CFT0_9ENTE|nr:hypothetical protein [Enterococcus sp. 4G2_DIV0659]OTO08780.1 hypothetical protein A5880_001780 [Enterococcus sp. 4G2_DIV0659]
MNFKNLVNEVKKQTSKDYEVCSDIINAYEKYCEEEIKRPFKEDIDTNMIDWISSSTNYDAQTVNVVLVSLVSIVREGLKNKIPFMK